MKTENSELNKLRTELSAEWNKPKKENLNPNYETRTPRDLKKIKELQEKIAELKKND